MSITNDFIPFATGGSANVEDQADYIADSQRTNGNQPGVASSALNNKALRQGTYIAAGLAQVIGNLTNTNMADNTVSAQLVQQITAALQFLPPTITSHLSGSGTHNVSVYFFVASASATTAATYTNNGVTYTVVGTITSGTLLKATGNGAPTAGGTLTKASGTGDATITFYAFRAPLSLKVRLVGGGGGGSGSALNGTGTTTGGTGGNSTFGTSLLAGNGGGGAMYASNLAAVGGTASLGSGPVGVAVSGGTGTGGNLNSGSTTTTVGGAGGVGAASPFGGAGSGGSYVNAGNDAAANSGSGGGGGGSNGAQPSTGWYNGNGGAAGGFVDATIPSPAYSYAWAVGAGGTAGGAGSNGNIGGAGGSGVVLVEERYQ